jgi:hypothetical protein
MKTAVNFHVAGKRRNKILSLRGNPVEHTAFETFGIITPCPRCALGELVICEINENLKT